MLRLVQLPTVPAVRRRVGPIAILCVSACGGKAIGSAARGEHVDGPSPGTGGTSSSICGPDPDDGRGQTPCIVASCSDGTTLVVSPTMERACEPCSVGTWDHDGASSSACIERNHCQPGELVSDDGNATSDRQCLPCPEGTFSTTQDAPECLPWSICPEDTVAVEAGTTTSDRTCVDGLWVRQFGAPSDDAIYGVGADQDGNVLVAGFSTDGLPGGQSAGGPDAFIRKYDAAGDELWTTQFGSSGADYVQSLAVGVDGSFAVSGFSGGALSGQTSVGLEDAFVSKYDAAGQQLWMRQFGTESEDYAYGVSVDLDGNVIVIGQATGRLTGLFEEGDSVFVRKYDGAGNELWTREFGTEMTDYGLAGCVDDDGNVFVAGHTAGQLLGQTSSGNYDVFVRKYDPSGAQIWTRQFGTSNGDFAYAIRADAGGNVYVAGHADLALPGQMHLGGGDAFVRKYDVAGNELWTRQFGTAAMDLVDSIAVDAAGNLVATGHTTGAFPGAVKHGSYDVFVRKYDSGGTELWTRQLGTTNSDVPYAVATDGSGHVLLSGGTLGSLPDQMSAGGYDAFVMRLAP